MPRIVRGGMAAPVVSLWFGRYHLSEAQPMLGRQMSVQPMLLLARPRVQAPSFADEGRAAGFTGEIVIAPILAIAPRPLATVPVPGTTLIFTSVNGVQH